MIYRSPYPNILIPEQPITEFVLQRAVELADKPALIEGLTNSVITYKQLAESIHKVAFSLAAHGFSKGDVLAIYSPNLPEYAIAFHAVATIGGIVTTVNPSYTTQELAYQLNDASAKYLITIPELLGQALEAVSHSKVEEVFVFGEAAGATPFSALLEGEGEIPKVQINPKEDLVALLYSSGTTGMPKGVMHTHYTFVANFHQFQNCEPISEESAVMGVLPFFHSYGMVMLLNYSLAKGATIVTMPRFDLETFLSLIEKHKITRIHVVPPILLALAKQPIVDKYNLSSLRVLTSVAAPLSHQLIRECEQRLPNCIVKQGYGATETFLNTYTPDERDKIKLGSVGQCLSHVECQIVAVDTQQPLGFHQAGELWIRGPQIMKGYLNNLEATANTIDRDGWYHTGDIVYVDEDGYFYIVDRIKELIKCNGYSIAPAELEAVLLSHPAVADACVVKSPHPSSGEVPKAFIVLKATATPEEIMQFVAERVAPHKMLRRLEFVDNIPKSASGKILRRILAQQELTKFTQASSDEQPLQLQREFLQQLDNASLRQRQELLIAYVQEQFVKVLGINTSQHLDIEKPLHELRLDSLMNIDLKNRIDTQLGVDIPIEIFLGNSNISQLVNLLLQQLAAKNTTLSKKVSALATDLNSEVVLDSTIKPEYSSESCVTEAAAIFLTGATGFLGAFLLQELLLKTQANVYCLVRSADVESGKVRIQNNLRTYGIWNEDFASRIIPIVGDLSQPLLGLSLQEFHDLSCLIDLIYHNAAWINYVYPYAALKPTNILGTQEILRLASQIKIKPVHYISTIAVFESPAYWGKVVTESDGLAHGEGMRLAYSQSKWVAEKLVMIARNRGIPVTIYRPPFISGHSQTGAWYKNDVICRTIKGCIQMGSMTDITERLDLAPVDYLSQSIVYLSKQQDSLGKAFHLNNPQPISWKELTDFLSYRGYQIEHIPYEDWQIQLNNSVRSKDNPLYHLLPFYQKSLPQEKLGVPDRYQHSTEPKISCLATQNALNGSSIVCPPVNAQLLNTYFSYFIRSGWLDLVPK